MLEPPRTFISPDALLSLPTRLHNLNGQIFYCVNSRVVSSSCLVSCPDPTHYARKGLVTFEGFLGCAHPHVLIQQARDLHVRIQFVYKIFTVSA